MATIYTQQLLDPELKKSGPLGTSHGVSHYFTLDDLDSRLGLNRH